MVKLSALMSNFLMRNVLKNANPDVRSNPIELGSEK